jgi:hypothetical protein
MRNLVAAAVVFSACVVCNQGIAAQEGDGSGEVFDSVSAYADTMDQAISLATAYGKTFKRVTSVSIVNTNDDLRPFAFAVFGYRNADGPAYIDLKGNKLKGDEAWVFERPLDDGRILRYLANDGDVAELVRSLTQRREDGETINDAVLDVEFWKDMMASCTGGTNCSTKTCPKGGKKASCSSCSTGGGTYCCC